MEKKKLYVDMDGVLCIFNKDKSLEEISEPGYFENLLPIVNVVLAIEKLSTEKDISITILSHVLNDRAAHEKRRWLDRNFKIDVDSVFVPYGISKALYLKKLNYPVKKAYLLDDFTRNLFEWDGIGIKLLNGINNTHHSWNGFVVNGKMPAEGLSGSIKALMNAG